MVNQEPKGRNSVGVLGVVVAGLFMAWAALGIRFPQWKTGISERDNIGQLAMTLAGWGLCLLGAAFSLRATALWALANERSNVHLDPFFNSGRSVWAFIIGAFAAGLLLVASGVLLAGAVLASL